MPVKQSQPLGESQDRFALVHRSIVNAKGLFRRVGSESDYNAVLDVWWRSTLGVYVRFWGPTLLGESEALVLVALLSIAGESSRVKLREPHASAKGAQNDVLSWLNSTVATTIEVCVSLRQLAAAIGLSTSGDSLLAVRRSLERLGAVSVWTGRADETRASAMANHQLLKVSLADDGRLQVRLPPLLVDALLGSRKDNTYVLLSSVLRLPARGYARFLALRLSWINPGEVNAVSLETLAHYLWPDREPTAVERSRLRASLKDLDGNGWFVSRKQTKSDEIYLIARKRDAGLPARPRRPRAAGKAEVRDI